MRCGGVGEATHTCVRRAHRVPPHLHRERPRLIGEVSQLATDPGHPGRSHTPGGGAAAVQTCSTGRRNDQPLNSLLNAAISESIGPKAPATGLLRWNWRACAATMIMECGVGACKGVVAAQAAAGAAMCAAGRPALL